MKKALVLTLVLFMATSMVACAAKEEPAAETEAMTEAPAETVATEAAETEPVEAEADGKVTIQYSSLVEPFEMEGYTEVEPNDMQKKACITKVYLDDDEMFDFLVSSEKNVDGKTLKEYVNDYAEAQHGCTSFFEMDGVDVGLDTFFTDINRVPYIYKNYTVENDGVFESLIIRCHTTEVAIGDSGYYIWVPSALEDHSSEYADDESTLAYYTGTDSYLADMYIWSWEADSYDYELGKENNESLGYTMVSKEQFDKWNEDGRFTLEEDYEYNKALVGDELTEEYDVTAAGTDIKIMKTEFDGADDVSTTQVLIEWLDVNTFYQISLVAPTAEWPNIGKATAYSLHRNDPEILGGWTDAEDSALSEEILGYFDAATSELVGASYEPLELLGTQVVAGTNYKILCNVTAVVPDAKPEKKIVTMYVDLQNNASITEVIDAE